MSTELRKTRKNDFEKDLFKWIKIQFLEKLWKTKEIKEILS